MRRSPKHWMFSLAAVVAIGGCSSLPPVLHSSDSSQVADLLSYYHMVSAESPDNQKRAFSEGNDAYARNPNSINALRLVLLLEIPGTSWRDDARAAQLLSGLDRSPKAMSSLQGDFVLLLEKMIQLRREDVKRCDSKLDGMRDERRKLEQRLEVAREECRRADVLQQKLDELRDIDRDLRTKRPSKRSK